MNLADAQAVLNTNGFPCDVDGVYGPKTRVALQHFQNATTVDLHNAGGFDAHTQSALEWLPRLSDHFTVGEARSKGNGTCYVRSELINALEDMRSVIGTPLPVHSMYRDPAHNKAVGGTTRSLHMFGLAADLPSATLQLTYDDVRGMGLFSGIGRVKRPGVAAGQYWVRHVDVRHATGFHASTPWKPSTWTYSS
ncbi:MAG: hypothetical protein KJO36_08300 [Acidimicrobiia bacterium]|nr:hypothetical protein [Acidimicrobiia bacterium]